MIKFTAENHKYESIIPDDIKWRSVTGIVHTLCKEFDADDMAPKSARNKKSKWYGMPVEEIKEAWRAENERSIVLGKWYHDIREQQHLKRENAVWPEIKDGVKYATSQVLQKGKVYPEHMVYLKTVGITGQSDIVEVTTDGIVNINDYKTSKEIKKEGWKNWEGVSEKLLAPLHHLDKCEYNLYALQLSMYMLIIQKHNPSLIPGKLTIEHIKFEVAGEDKYGYPVYWTDKEGNYLVKDIVLYELPYMKKEVIKLIDYIRNER